MWSKDLPRKRYLGEIKVDLKALFANTYNIGATTYPLENDDENNNSTVEVGFQLTVKDPEYDISKLWAYFLDCHGNGQWEKDSDLSETGGDFEGSGGLNSSEYDSLVDKLNETSIDRHTVSDSGQIDSSSIKSSADGMLAVPVVSKRSNKKGSKDSNVPSGFFEFNSKTQVVGLLHLDIVSAKDLPPLKNATRTGFDMDPFVVISFGKKTFRTPHVRHNLNPVFNERIMLPVLQHEQNYTLDFTVIDKDKFSDNDLVGKTFYNVKDIIEQTPLPNPHTQLYDLTAPYFTDGETQSYELPLALVDKDYIGKHNTTLTIRYRYLPYGALRQQFWRGLIKIFDTDNSNSMNFYEISELLEAIGSTLSDHTVLSYFDKFNKNIEEEDLTIDELVMCLEEQVLKDTVAQQDKTFADDNDHDFDEKIFELKSCPFCDQPRMDKRDELDIITHLATCSSQAWSTKSSENVIMNSFVTSKQATKRWFSKVVTKVTYGNYKLGANSANILVQDRVSGQIQEEKMSVYVRLGIRVLYQGIRGTKNMEIQRTKELLRSLSIRQGKKYDSPESVSAILPFIEFHKLDTEEMLNPVSSFKNFNEFFYRKLKPGARPVDSPDDDTIVVSAADSRSTYFPTIDKATEIWIKGRDFSIERLFGKAYPEYVENFTKNGTGSLCIFRLAPQDYHRFHMPVSGVLGKPITIEGEYYTVNPMAIRSGLDVYGENVRVLVPVFTEFYGVVMMVCVGAMMVGSTVITAKEGQKVNKGDELGYFQFGGSTIVVLFESDKVKFDEDLVNNSSQALETLVKVGTRIGKSPLSK